MSIAAMFNNLTVRTKLVVAFSLLLLATAGLGMFATAKLGDVAGHGEYINKVLMPSVTTLSEVEAGVTQYRLRENDLIFHADPAQREAERAALDRLRGAVDTRLKAYDPLVDDPKERALADAINDGWTKYLALHATLETVLRDKGQAAATAFYTDSMKETATALRTALRQDIDFNAKQIADAVHDGEATYVSARFWIIGAIGLVIALCGVAVWLLVRSVSAPLNLMTGAMTRLAGGNLDVSVPAADRKDEIGELASAMSSFKDELTKADAARRENEAAALVHLFKSAPFDGSAVPMMIIDRDFKIIYINEATKRLMRDNAADFRAVNPNFDPDHIVGTNIDNFHRNPAHQRRALSDPSRLPFKADISVGELKIALNVSGVFDKDRNYVGNVLEWNDVTQVRTTAGMIDALQRSQAVVEFGMDGRVLNANRNFLDALGYSLEEIRGQHHSMFVDPAERQSAEYRAFWDKLGRGAFDSGKYRRIGKGGREVWIQATYNPILDGAGKPFKVVKFAADVTAVENERKAVESERAERTAELNVVVSSLASGLKNLAGGDLVAQLDQSFAADYEQLRVDFNAAMTKLRDTMSTVLSATSGISTGAGEISQAADDLSKRTEQQAASLEETAAALEEITATVKKTAQNAKEASTIVTNAKSAAEDGGRVVETAIQAMGQIAQSSKQITDIIGVIDEIAFQTNLLALNAGVEAARAGDAGKGFAVVASEVRALAQRSSEAAREIKTLIKTSGEQVDSGVKLVGESGTALKRIVDQVVEINALVTEMAQAAQQQSTGIEEVNTAVSQMDQVTQQNAAMVEQSTAASRNLATETSELSRLVSFFNVGADSAPPARTAAPAHPSPGRSAARAVPRAAPSAGGRRAASALALKPAEDDWEEF